jgi:hypothetical protein
MVFGLWLLDFGLARTKSKDLRPKAKVQRPKDLILCEPLRVWS